ncbi:MAG: hypothetical protein RBU45_16630 [Myxococcota bacterium]|jgi:hypothetical protein|nr:hypothetical protein [Myxococcota bacterium]
MVWRSRVPVLLPEPLLGYRCNLQGCCCGGWGITWTADDLGRLARRLPPEELEELTRHQVELLLAEDGTTVTGARLKASQPGGRCPYLAEDGRCTLQQRFGVEGLPGICVDFPVVPHWLDDHVELAYRFTCPGALDCVFADQGPVAWARLDTLDAMYASRLQRVGPLPTLKLDGQPLPPSALQLLRERILVACNDRRRPTLELLAAIETGLAALQRLDQVPAFQLQAPTDPLPFVRYLLHCVRTHSADYLLHNLQRQARFLVGRWAPAPGPELGAALESWEAGLVEWIEPAEPALRPFLQRYLWLRFASCFVHLQGELRYPFGEVTHELALALRYLAAFCQVTGRPPDQALLFAALAASAHLFHTHSFPFQSRVWFDPEHFAEEREPPPQVPDELEVRCLAQSAVSVDTVVLEEPVATLPGR